MRPIIISVISDQNLYGKCIRQNVFCTRCDFIGMDNCLRKENIPVLYNRAIKSLPADCDEWLIFCHQDFEIREHWEDVLVHLSKEMIYGPVGFKYYKRHGWDVCVGTFGELSQSAKDGSDIKYISNSTVGRTIVDTIDCVCIIVHSSLVKKYGLHFDENLTFDLYAEDFCIAANELYRIHTGVALLKGHHWSNSVPVGRYYVQLKYLNKKWPHCCYAAACSFGIGGGWSYAGLFRRLKTSGVKTKIRNLIKHIILKCK